MSRAQTGRAAKIAAVDDHYMRRTPAVVESEGGAVQYERTRHDVLLDERLIRSRIKSERSAAYWFAASKWGMMGLIAGAFLGGAGMYVASIAIMEPAQDAIARGQAMEYARTQSERETYYVPAPTTPTTP